MIDISTQRSIATIPADLMDIALQKSSGHDFERFAQSFFSSLLGSSFVPLGGTKDGGADGFTEAVLESKANSDEFFQASITEDPATKIRKTITRLRDVGRTPKSLLYSTSRRVPMLDQLESEITRETSVFVRIRDGSFLVSHINDTPGTIEAFRSHLERYTDFLKRLGTGFQIDAPKNVLAPEVFVFLRHEIDRHPSGEALNIALADSLILWALEGTDPDEGKTMSEEEILKKTRSFLPNDDKNLNRTIKRRLSTLSSSAQPEGVRIRHYKKEGRYCLPFEQRQAFVKENLEDHQLREGVLNQFHIRIQKITESEKISANTRKKYAETALKCIENAFSNLGLEFAAYVNCESEAKENRELGEIIDCHIRKEFNAPQYDSAFAAITDCIRSAIYSGTQFERLFFSRLSRTYSLLLCLKNDVRVAEYFQNLAGRFDLLIGSDILVQALSERYVGAESQLARNLLKVASEYGSRLLLTEPVLDEVISHFHASDLEYRNNYQDAESYITPEIAFQSDRILIRAYYRARFDNNLKCRPGSWQGFVNQFCDPSDLRKKREAKLRDQIKRYLVQQLKMQFVAKDELLSLVSKSELEKLTNAFLQLKDNNRFLAESDALMALSVYGLRKRNKETGGQSAFGYGTWWVTNEYFIIERTRELAKKEGARYLMKPEFLLNFIALSPKATAVRTAYESIFPSALGLSLGRRVKPEVLHNVLSELRSLKALEPGRATAKIAELSDKLKSDYRKIYQTNLSDRLTADECHS